MTKLTRQQTSLHNQACDLLKKASLTDEDREFVLRHYHPGAGNNVGGIGAFFTPQEAALEF